MFTMCNYNKEVGDLDCRGAGVRKSIQEVALKLGPKLSLLLRKQENRIKRIDSDCFTKITEVDSKYQNPHTRPRWPQMIWMDIDDELQVFFFHGMFGATRSLDTAALYSL